MIIYLTNVNTSYVSDVYIESTIYNQQATRDQHSDIIFGLTFFLTSCSILLHTAIYMSILKIIASNLEGMLLRDRTMQRQHSLDFIFINITTRYLLSYPGPFICIFAIYCL